MRRWVTEKVVRDALRIAAGEHGHVLNCSLFARQLHLSVPTVRVLLRAMANMGWIRILPAFCPEGVTGCFRKPRLQLTSSPLLARILGSRLDGKAMAVSLTESIIRAEGRISSRSRFLHFGGYELRSLDLIVERDGSRTGYLFADASEPHTRKVLPLRRAISQGVIQRGFVLHSGDRCYFSGRNILAVPADVFVARYEDFTAPQERFEVWYALAQWVYLAAVGYGPVERIIPQSPFGIHRANSSLMALVDRL